MSGMYKNRYKIPEEQFSELIKLGEKDLGTKMEQYYVNWITEVENKKKDGEIERLSEKRTNLKKEVENNEKVIELKQQLEKLKFELTSEELARIDEELKNARSSYNESIKEFRSYFYTCADLKTKRLLGE